MTGDEAEMQQLIDMIHEIQGVKDSDHVKSDGMCQVDENGKIQSQHDVIRQIIVVIQVLTYEIQMTIEI